MIDDKKEQKKNPEEERIEPAPITDGDSRPDKFVDPDFSQAKKAKSKAPVSSNRQADIDKSEDYKDAK